MTGRIRLPRPLAVGPALLAGLLGAVPVASGASPQQDYISHCQGCHAPGGIGVPGKVPPLRETLPAFARSARGRAFVLSVPGASNSSLGDSELAAVMSWLLERFATDASAQKPQPFTTDEVTRLRRPALSQVRATRSAVLQSLAGTGPVPSEDY